MTQLAITANDNKNLFSNYYLEAKALYSEYLGAPGAEDLDRISVLLTLLVNIILTALGLRPQTPGEAPPMAGLNVRSLAA
ncbi:MAG: hypothetical protein WA130_02205 [Candidatus Methanoperedens sp.]